MLRWVLVRFQLQPVQAYLMPKKQSRRSISIRGLTHQRATSWCTQQKRSLSGLLEELLAEHLDKVGQPVETILRTRVWTKNKTGPKPTSYKHGGLVTF